MKLYKCKRLWNYEAGISDSSALRKCGHSSRFNHQSTGIKRYFTYSHFKWLYITVLEGFRSPPIARCLLSHTGEICFPRSSWMFLFLSLFLSCLRSLTFLFELAFIYIKSCFFDDYEYESNILRFPGRVKVVGLFCGLSDLDLMFWMYSTCCICHSCQAQTEKVMYFRRRSSVMISVCSFASLESHHLTELVSNYATGTNRSFGGRSLQNLVFQRSVFPLKLEQLDWTEEWSCSISEKVSRKQYMMFCCLSHRPVCSSHHSGVKVDNGHLSCSRNIFAWLSEH